jgi:hypothetical protein
LCVRDERDRLHISRAAVFDVAAASAADPTPENCERTMVAVAAWGAGTRWYSVVRSRKPWRSGHGRFPTIVGERLCSAVHVLFDEGPIEAYELLLGGVGHVSISNGKRTQKNSDKTWQVFWRDPGGKQHA